jgi:hypothetical protein
MSNNRLGFLSLAPQKMADARVLSANARRTMFSISPATKCRAISRVPAQFVSAQLIFGADETMINLNKVHETVVDSSAAPVNTEMIP